MALLTIMSQDKNTTNFDSQFPDEIYSQELKNRIKALNTNLEELNNINEVTENLSLFENKVSEALDIEKYEIATRIKNEQIDYITTNLHLIRELLDDDANIEMIINDIQRASAGDFETINIFLETIEDGMDGFKALIEAKKVYGEDKEMFKDFVEILEEEGSDGIKALIEAKELCGKDDEMFKEFLELAKSYEGTDGVKILIEAKKICGEDIDLFKDFLKLSKTKGGSNKVKTLMKAKEICGEDKEMFNLFVETLKTINGSNKVRALIEAKEVYGGDKEIFKIFAEVVSYSDEADRVEALMAAKEVYGDDKEIFKIFAEVVSYSNGADRVKALMAAKKVYGDDKEMLKLFAKAATRWYDGKDSVKALIRAKKLYKEDQEILKLLLEVLEQEDSQGINKTLIILEELLEKGTTVEQETKKTRADDIRELIFAKYFNPFKEKSKGLISSDIPEMHRDLPQYQWMVRYVFPKGDYSNYEQNLACGDKLNHLEKYKFQKEGYETTMSGLLGYKLKEGTIADSELLEQYTKRLHKIRNFVSSRGPDNEALQKEFDEKVAKLFTEKATDHYQNLGDLTMKEQLLCLFLSEIERKTRTYKTNEEVCDLVVEYKYAYHENLENYVARSADSVKKTADQDSQNYLLLSELSTIYGENIKHILRHDIFEEINNSPNYGRIVETFGNNIAKDEGLKKKQWDRVYQTFSNEKIESERKPKVLYGQLRKMLSSNIKFENEEEEKDFEKKYKNIFNQLKDNFSIEKIKELAPQFLQLRNRYHSGVNAKIQEFFNYDINRLFSEINKYEEIIEIEDKETQMGGAKHKKVEKSSKKREIIGHFTKTAETANARMGAYLCIAGDTKMWKNWNYFEFVMTEKESGKCCGLAMLLRIKAQNGQNYLWFGPNPFEGFLEKVSGQQCFDWMYQVICKFAEENGFDGVVVPAQEEQILGGCTNRGGDFPGIIKSARLRDKKGKVKVVSFGKTHELGGDYGYKDGALIWERKKN